MKTSQLTDASISGLFSLHAFQVECFLMSKDVYYIHWEKVREKLI